MARPLARCSRIGSSPEFDRVGGGLRKRDEGVGILDRECCGIVEKGQMADLVPHGPPDRRCLAVPLGIIERRHHLVELLVLGYEIGRYLLEPRSNRHPPKRIRQNGLANRIRYRASGKPDPARRRRYSCAVGGTRWLDDVEMGAWRGLMSAHSKLVARLDASLQESQGISLPDYEVLVHLSEAPEDRMRMCELAGRLNLSPSGLTRRLDGLVRGGVG